MGHDNDNGHDNSGHGDDGPPMGGGHGVCNNFPWLPWCSQDPPDPPDPTPCEGPGCLPDPYDPYDPEDCTRTCEPIGSGEDTTWRCSYTCGTPQVNAFLGWADTRIAELQAWAGPLVDQFFNTLGNFEGMGEYALENLDTMKDLFREMIAQFTNLSNLDGIRSALESINLKIPTLEQYQEAMQELLSNITIHLSPPSPTIEPCTDILKPQCWANIWQHMLENITNPPPLPTIPPVPLITSRAKRKTIL